MGTLGRAFYAVGFWIRETGQAIDRLGSRLQGNYLFQEQRMLYLHFSVSIFIRVSFQTPLILISIRNYSVSRHRPLMNLFDKAPSVHRDAFVAPSASLLGDVHVGPASSIWYGCVLRGKPPPPPQLFPISYFHWPRVCLVHLRLASLGMWKWFWNESLICTCLVQQPKCGTILSEN